MRNATLVLASVNISVLESIGSSTKVTIIYFSFIFVPIGKGIGSTFYLSLLKVAFEYVSVFVVINTLSITFTFLIFPLIFFPVFIYIHSVPMKDIIFEITH